MRVLTSAEFIFVEPDHGVVSPSLRISRPGGDVSVISRDATLPDPATALMDYCYALIGFVTLLRGEYLVFVTEAETVAYVLGHEVLRVLDVKLIPISNNTAQNTPAEDKYITLIKQQYANGTFYFSNSMDLTNSIQRQADIAELQLESRFPKDRIDKRFFWNYNFAKKLIEGKFDEWVVPVISGFVEIHKMNIGSKKFEILLISRREWFNAGTRFITRGVNSEGHAANFAEQEQVILYSHQSEDSNEDFSNFLDYLDEQGSRVTVCSFVQTRGSIPFFWRQKACLRLTPKIEIYDEEKAGEGFHKHFDSQRNIYKSQIIVNLVNQKGSEGRLERKYKDLVQACRAEDALSYVSFDFHKECKRSWENLKKLMAKVEHNFEEMGYFHGEYIRNSNRRKFVVSKRQKSNFRTNCIDCLDRTNVVQSMFAKHMAEKQLFNLGLIDSPDSLKTNSKFDSTMKHLWADNADVMSILYSGTGALKTDFTRTGMRTRVGALKDGKNSLVRYLLNNFSDGDRQDAIDLVTGKYIPRSAQYPGSRSRSFAWLLFRVYVFVCVLLLSSGMCGGLLKCMLLSVCVSVFVCYVYAICVCGADQYVSHARFLDH
jgi:hypothetical protein